ncbi:MAG: sulfotransferase [Saprospiraceae bacterium]|nr:sulfotransferase [Saprospiraceae bacterium]
MQQPGSTHDQRLPDFVIIGAGKCGTTALWKELKAHPALCGSRIKETNYFGAEHGFRDLAWYTGLFKEPGKITFEASPDYTSLWYCDLVPARMHALIPDARLIFMVRHPVDRAISRVLHRLRKNQVRYRDIHKLGFWRYDSQGCEAIAGSQYFRVLSHFLKYYDRSDIIIHSNEDLRDQPAQVYNAILDFVGAPGPRYGEDHAFVTANVTSEKRRITWNKAHWRLRRLHERRWIPPLHQLFEAEIRKPNLSSEILNYLWSCFEEDLKKFESLTGCTFNYAPPPVASRV